MSKPSLVLMLLVAAVLGAVARDLFVDRALASDDVIPRSGVDRAVRALEAQAKAAEQAGRDVREAARACK